jgi:hypothetical protein
MDSRQTTGVLMVDRARRARPASTKLLPTLYAIFPLGLCDAGREGFQLLQNFPRALDITRIPSPLEFHHQLLELRQ